MITVRSDEPGFLVIDFSNEPGFDIATDGLELQAGVFVEKTLPRSIVIDDTGQLGPVVQYVTSVLAAQGYEVMVDPALAVELQGLQEEEELVRQIMAGEVKKLKLIATPSTEPGLGHGIFF
jgi:hypothetical protein